MVIGSKSKLRSSILYKKYYTWLNSVIDNLFPNPTGILNFKYN
jgi:hypothetical protein